MIGEPVLGQPARLEQIRHVAVPHRDVASLDSGDLAWWVPDAHPLLLSCEPGLSAGASQLSAQGDPLGGRPRLGVGRKVSTIV